MRIRVHDMTCVIILIYSLYVVKPQTPREAREPTLIDHQYTSRNVDKAKRHASIPVRSVRSQMLSIPPNAHWQRNKDLSLEDASSLGRLVAVDGLEARNVIIRAQSAAVENVTGALAVVAHGEALGVRAGEVCPAGGDELRGLARDGAGGVLVEADPQGGGADVGARAGDEAAAQVVVVVDDLVDHEGGQVVSVGPCGVGDEVDGRAVLACC